VAQKKKKKHKPSRQAAPPVVAMTKNGGNEETEKHAEQRTSNRKSIYRKERRPMSIYIFGAGLTIGAILLGFAGVKYGQQGYSNYVIALIIGSTGYVVLGIGLAAGYWANVIKPAKKAISDIDIRERAYIAIGDASITPLVVGRKPTMKITFLNTGRTPAWDFHVSARFTLAMSRPTQEMIDVVKATETPDRVFVPADKGTEVYLAGIGFTLTEERIAAFNAGVLKLYVNGEARYRDIVGPNQLFSFCGEYNDATKDFFTCPEQVPGRAELITDWFRIIDLARGKQPHIWFKIFNVGDSATITEVAYKLAVFPEIPPLPDYTYVGHTTPTLSTLERGQEAEAVSLPILLNSAMISNVLSKKYPLHFWGRITYTDKSGVHHHGFGLTYDMNIGQFKFTQVSGYNYND
jgi:hypothetical protein